MLTVRELKTNVWELTLDGIVTRSDIETMERDLTPVLRGDGPIGLIVRAEGLKDLTGDALAEDARFEVAMMAQWAKIAKMAVVSDLQAVAALSKWIAPILPKIDLRAFGSSEVAAAERFAADLPAGDGASQGKGMRLLSDGSDGLVAYEIDGRISAGEVDELLAPLEARMQGDAKFDLLVRIRNYDGFDPAILTDGSLFGTKMKAITHVRRYAIVGAPKWMAAMAGTFAGLLPFEMKLFDASQDDAAWTWVRAS